jgi:hypothetical protein
MLNDFSLYANMLRKYSCDECNTEKLDSLLLFIDTLVNKYHFTCGSSGVIGKSLHFTSSRKSNDGKQNFSICICFSDSTSFINNGVRGDCHIKFPWGFYNFKREKTIILKEKKIDILDD